MGSHSFGSRSSINIGFYLVLSVSTLEVDLRSYYKHLSICYTEMTPLNSSGSYIITVAQALTKP